MPAARVAQEWVTVSNPLLPSDRIPPERKVVAVWLRDSHLPFCGYIRYAAGDRECPYFVVYHGNAELGADVVAWCDCLPDVGPAVPTAEMYTREQATGRGFPARAAITKSEGK
jgi:hypothetical protein